MKYWVNVTNEQAAALKSFGIDINEMEDEESTNKYFYIKDGDPYYYISNSGDVYNSTWSGDYKDETDTDVRRMNIGNVFLVREDAKYEVERMKTIAKLRKFAVKKYNPRELHIYLRYDYDRHEINRIKTYSKGADLSFAGDYIVSEAIKAVGEENVLRYYLGVDENEIKEYYKNNSIKIKY